jgi:serine/threonine protein kinase/tetratricopeptide (TPR) repeat protein
VTNPNSDPLVGRTVGQYEILSRVGGGGMGVVYTARDTRLTRIVALKFLPPQWSHDATAKERFVREAQAASATNHPNICTIHDIETADDGQLFIVMAYYEGQTLKARLEPGPLPIEEALDIAMQVADGLAKAHAQGVVHRDIKPGNLILTEEGVRILDFGLATFADALKLTTENALLGTVAYMSPEQVRGQQADARTDVWATGAVLYEMLTGHAPFGGSHAEAIGYAVRNEQPMPIREERPDVPEEVEQLVFRALHKEPTVRFASGRELARALRQVRGLSVPLDLRTQPVPEASTVRPRRNSVGPKRWIAAACVVALAAAVAIWWLFRPTARVILAVAPVENQSGYADLNRFKFALTQSLVDSLSDSRAVRVVPYVRFLEITRSLRIKGSEPANADMIQALAAHSGASVLVVPTVVQENGRWRGRAEIRDLATATTLATIETDQTPSALEHDVAQHLVVLLASKIDVYLTSVGPMQASIAAWMRRQWRRRDEPESDVVRPLEAAQALEDGLDAYERMEYDAALAAFRKAAELSRNPQPMMWRSRVARLVRYDDEARQAARDSLNRLDETTSTERRLLVQAVAAEARDEFVDAERYLRALSELKGDEPYWAAELAAFLERRGRIADAIVVYTHALELDHTMPRPDVELCRLYNRDDKRLNAIDHGNRARTKYESLGNQYGIAQALMCLSDSLAPGNATERQEARRYANEAVKRLSDVESKYNLARAENYAAMTAGLVGNLSEALDAGQRALTAARATGNKVLEPLVLMNLGVTNARMRRRNAAIEFYRQSSEGFRALGDQRRAAQNHLNAGWLAIDYGVLGEGRRDVEAALAVFDTIGDKSFEVSCRHALGMYHLASGQYEEAETQLNRALELARDQRLFETISTLTIDLAQVKSERGDYEAARAGLDTVVGNGQAEDTPRALIRRAQTTARWGDFAAARTDLRQAAHTLQERKNTALDPLRLLVEAEIAYDSGDITRAARTLTEAVALSDPDFPEPASVDARIQLGWITGISGDPLAGQRLAEHALAEARRTGRTALIAGALVTVARMKLDQHRLDEAAGALNEVLQADILAAIGPELRARAYHWRGIVKKAQGKLDEASRDLAESEQTVARIRTALSGPHRAPFDLRTSVRDILK